MSVFDFMEGDKTFQRYIDGFKTPHQRRILNHSMNVIRISFVKKYIKEGSDVGEARSDVKCNINRV